jgi:glycosyltransferase involved in cell wall biosynthesis
MKNISIIIPTYNEQDYLDRLLISIKESNYPTTHYEVLVVNDGSTDNTSDLVVAKHPWVRLIDLEANVGRYHARQIGARGAKYANILFIDSRSILDPDALNVINQSDSKAIKGRVEKANPNNPFHIFFESIRHKLYPDFYRQSKAPFKITEDNFDRVLKGTGVFFVQKDILFQALESLSSLNIGKVYADDTALLREITKLTEIIYHPGLRIKHFIRDGFIENLMHLIYRGRTFIHYYLNPSKKQFWLVLILPALLLMSLTIISIFLSIQWYLILGLLILLDLTIALYLSKDKENFLTISYMIPVCTFAFYMGILFEIAYQITLFVKKSKDTDRVK